MDAIVPSILNMCVCNKTAMEQECMPCGEGIAVEEVCKLLGQHPLEAKEEDVHGA